jgi:hypothetical protein
MRLERRLFLLMFPAAAICFADGPASSSVRGKLTQANGQAPALETGGGKRIALDGDEPTRGILKDKRLAGADMEATGHFARADEFMVDPIHTTALHVYKGGKRLKISYWCSTCSIRTYTPGPCWCCQQETELDLQDDGK